jgi:hypothetical protein
MNGPKARKSALVRRTPDSLNMGRLRHRGFNEFPGPLTYNSPVTRH